MKKFLSEPPSSSTKYLLTVKEVAVYDECVKSKWRICQSLLPVGTSYRSGNLTGLFKTGN